MVNNIFTEEKKEMCRIKIEVFQKINKQKMCSDVSIEHTTMQPQLNC